MANTAAPRPLVVAVLDGWGVSFVQQGNAIAAASTPNMDEFLRLYPSAAIQAAGMEVGLPWGEVGNSETGHRNIGAGNVQYQVLPLIDNAIVNGSFFQNPALRAAVEHAKKNNSALHIMGLISPGGVHAHMNHVFALLALCKQMNKIDHVYIHMFTDGRDTPPQSALSYLKSLEEAIGRYGIGTVVSVMGRFYAMDRNRNWERTEAAYNVLIGGPRQAGAPSAEQAIQQAYQHDITDEMIPPTAITRGGGPIAAISDNDSVIFTNFRADRARQLTYAFADPKKVQFKTKPLNNMRITTLSQYSPDIPAPHAYVEEPAEYPLARVLSEAGLQQFHMAETEKYAHVTYYLNVGHEELFPGEQRELIHSSDIPNFSAEPEMQAGPIADRTIQEIQTGTYDVYFLNFANADMVGHTGDFAATQRACSFVDTCLGNIAQAAHAAGGALLVTADHGNAEEMLHPETGAPEKDHTSNPVPFHYVHPQLKRTTAKSDAEVQEILSYPIGVLADVAPTILEILQLPKPAQMTGVSLLGSLR